MAKQALAFSVLALSVLVALAGCTNQMDAPAKPPSAASDPGPDFTTPVKADWNVDVDLVGAPVAKDGVVVSYVTGAEGGLDIVVWNASTGVELWRDAAMAGNGSSDISVDAHIVQTEGRTVVPYIRDLAGDETGWQDVVVADAVTGAPIALDQPSGWVTQRPGECADGTGVCFSGIPINGQNADNTSFRVDLTAGTVGRDQDVALPTNSRLLGSRVYSTFDRAPDGVEMLGFSARGKAAWEVPYTDVFGENYTSDDGWAWQDRGADGLVVGRGTIWDASIDMSADYSYERADSHIVALDPVDGTTKWDLADVGDCTAAQLRQPFAGEIIPACRVNSGVVHVVVASDGSVADTTDEDVDVDLVGINRATGDIEWSTPVGGDGSLFNWRLAGFASNIATRPINVNGHVQIIDVLTGKGNAAPEKGVFACRKMRATAELPYYSEANQPYYIGDNVFPCDINTDSLDASVFSPQALLMGGVDAGDR